MGDGMSHMLVIPILFGALVAVDLQAADLAREQRIRAQIEDAILVGEPITLQTGGQDFLAIHTEAQTPKRQGAAILLHGRGANADWADVIHPLRTGLAAHGWETLSLQMPVAAAEAPGSAYRRLIPEAFPRIAFGLEFLVQRQIDRVVIIGHSLGARMALEWLARETPRPVRALVAVGLSSGSGESDAGTLDALTRLRLPVLDIYGSHDAQSVRHTAPQRAAAARKADNDRYRQLEIQGADHLFHGHDHELLTRVRAWLYRVAAADEEPL
jgi:pimeloyl-ACP methyl ester carboxylesterase